MIYNALYIVYVLWKYRHLIKLLSVVSNTATKFKILKNIYFVKDTFDSLISTYKIYSRKKNDVYSLKSVDDIVKEFET